MTHRPGCTRCCACRPSVWHQLLGQELSRARSLATLQPPPHSDVGSPAAAAMLQGHAGCAGAQTRANTILVTARQSADASTHAETVLEAPDLGVSAPPASRSYRALVALELPGLSMAARPEGGRGCRAAARLQGGTTPTAAPCPGSCCTCTQANPNRPGA